MIDSGAMLISGKRCGQILLQLGSRRDNPWGAVPTKAGATFEDVVFDAELKLDDLKGARSPVETEIAFVEQWLESARGQVSEKAAPEVPEEKEKVIPIS